MAAPTENQKLTLSRQYRDNGKDKEVSKKRKRVIMDPEEAAYQKQRTREASKQYGRGKSVNVRSVKDKKLRGSLRELENRNKEAVLRVKDAEILLENHEGMLEAESELERTYKVRQDEIRNDVSIETAKKGFELKLNDTGPYKCDYTRNGRELLLASRKGHVATMKWREGKLGCELQLGETVRDACWLHNNQSFAVAQKNNIFIYDSQGTEIHRLSKHVEPSLLTFLPYHYLLVSLSLNGVAKWFDTSMGQIVAEHTTKLGTPQSLCQNPHNGVIHVGHQNGQITLRSPNSQDALAKVLAHRGPVRSLAVDREGRYMVSAGQDSRMAVWDIRMFKEVNNYFLRAPAQSIDISDRGLVSVGWNTTVSVWRGLFDKSRGDAQLKVQSPYMAWPGEGRRIENLKWCPFEDVLGIGHDRGFSSILVPGAGEPNYDALEVNPYETPKQRQENEVRTLLDKLQPEMISLNPDFIGKLDTASKETRKKEEKERKGRSEKERVEDMKASGKKKSLRKMLKRSENILDERKLRLQELVRKQNEKAREDVEKQKESYGPALARFAKSKAST